MNRLPAIQVLRDTAAHCAVDDAIERIRDDLYCWGHVMEPEEQDHTRFILERLLDLQAHAVRSATTRGTTMAEREAEQKEAA